MNPDNAWILRITAAAGTELADPYSYSTISPLHVEGFFPVQKKFTTHRAFILHAAWLDQSCDRTPQVDHLMLSLRRVLCIAHIE